MKRITVYLLAVFAAISLMASPAFAADPSLHEIYQVAEGGNLKKAQSMMDQVLREHPNSAKAHYVDAELLVREGRLDMAKAELTTAERLAPGLPFAKPESVQALKRHFPDTATAVSVSRTPTASPISANIPWGMVLIGLGLLAAVIFFVRSLNRPPVSQSRGVEYGAPGGGFGNGYANPMASGGVGPMGATGGGMGSGILGGLATGAAMGAGLVAGEALMHKVFDGGSGAKNHVSDATAFEPIDNPSPANGYDMGGSDFGVSESASWDDNSGGASGDDW